jgi:hypothetical protein
VNESGSRASSARTAEPPPIARAGARTVARTAPARGSVHAGTALSPQEILGILSHAGSGCPLGPCLGCRHHDVQSGSCTA